MNCFFDTNVIVYAYDPGAGVKQVQAHALIERHAGDRTITVSTQVLQETYSVLVRKRYLDPARALRVVDGLSNGRVVPADAASVRRGLQLSQRYLLWPWDGLIVQAALDAGCTTLLTEDMQAGQRFGELEVVNPISQATHEARAAWPPPAARKSARKPAREPAGKRATTR